TMGAMLVIPLRDCTAKAVSGMLLVLGSTLLAYSATNLLVLLAAWVMTTVPFFVGGWFGTRSWRPRAGLLLASMSLALAITLMAADGHSMAIDALKGQSPGGIAVFGLLV